MLLSLAIFPNILNIEIDTYHLYLKFKKSFYENLAVYPWEYQKYEQKVDHVDQDQKGE
jgi:hypothetical protein